MDEKISFLEGELNGEIYMDQPIEFELRDNDAKPVNSIFYIWL